MFDAIGTVLAWLYDLTNNYGLAIMLLTLAIMIILTPLTLKGTRSMIAMQRLQPEMKRIQNRYKDDRQKLNEEMMQFYKDNSINPVGGCLPLVLQMPVFFVLYRVLYGLTNPAPYAEDMGKAFGLAAKTPGAVYPQFGAFHPNHLDHTSQMYKNLSNAREIKSFGLDLATSASHVLSTNFVKGLPYLLLIVIIGITAWYQQKQIQGRNPQAQQQINPQQQMLMKIMPYFLPLISFALPAGVILYFVVSNLYRIAQQGFITRTMYHDAHGNPIPTTAVDTSSTDDGGPQKGFFAQLKEIAGNSGPPPAPAKGAKGSAAKGSTAKGQGRANLAKGAKAGSARPSSAKGTGGAKGGAKPNSAKPNGAKAGPPPKAAPPKRGGGAAARKAADKPAPGIADASTNGSSSTPEPPAQPPARGAGPSRRAPSRSAPPVNPDRTNKKKRS